MRLRGAGYISGTCRHAVSWLMAFMLWFCCSKTCSRSMVFRWLVSWTGDVDDDTPPECGVWSLIFHIREENLEFLSRV